MTDRFKIFSICVVKNEADVIAHSITEAAKWSDRILVLDNGSQDGTWEIVQSMASDVVVPWKRDARPFNDGMRSDVFNQFRHEARTDDWWCRFDADEFYAVDPRAFLADVPCRHHVVWGAAIEYHLTRSDVTSLDFSVPIEQLLPKLTHYRTVNSEARFFRYRENIDWPDRGAAWPKHMGIVHPRRIPFRHYQFRSPEQIRQRLATRREAIDRGAQTYWSKQSPDWETHLADPASCRVRQDGQMEVIDEATMPQHLERLPHRLVKFVMHGTGLWV